MECDTKALANDLNELRDKLRAEAGEEDLKHLKKMVLWGRMSTLVGYLTAWIIPNPLSIWLISQGIVSRWTMVAHHVIHRGYDKLEGTPRHLTSKGFAKGWRRVLDWMDCVHPEAWREEHNFLHHYKLGESHDPDQPELKLDFMRSSRFPAFVNYTIIFVFLFTWRFIYYAPNTARIWYEAWQRRNKVPVEELKLTSLKVWLPWTQPGSFLWFRCWLPYVLFHFVLLPLPFLLISQWAFYSVLINRILAEAVSNFHSFLIIVPNHAGDDVYRFETPIENQEEFYLRQIIGSVNYKTGGNYNDFLHGWLNYQIEHHLWPDLTMLQYQKAQPHVKAICEKHNVPYIQESVWIRLGKLFDIMLGNTSMKLWAPLPAKDTQIT